ncbi:MAG: DUF2277 domain-containing protein [Chloroflexi bacterium]|nr:DUF2277 domain-containing protein [Chloroflexota bacterium]
MCRSIRTLRSSAEPATTGEVHAAARQYVRKVSGFREPSARNEAAFDAAIAEIAAASERLILALGGGVEDGPDRKPHGHPHPSTSRARPMGRAEASRAITA